MQFVPHYLPHYTPFDPAASSTVPRQAFRVARNASPCVLFLDEMDALVTDRATSGGGPGVSVEARVLATLLTEMDGISSGSGSGGDGGGRGGGGAGANSDSDHVIVMGATNRVDCIDAALLRKGRFHQIIHVPLPGADDRIALLRYFAGKCALSEDRIRALQASPGFLKDRLSGADIENLVKMEVFA